MKEIKTVPTSEPVEAFLASIESEKRRNDSRHLMALIATITDLTPVMWGTSIVGYGSYHYKYASGREGDTMIIGFAPRKDALVIYGVLYYDQNLKLSEQLGPHTAGKGCLYIKDFDIIHTNVLADMIAIALQAKNSLK